MSHPAFSLLRQVRINNLNLEVQEYHHLVTGARHLHLAAEDDNNAFLVAFLTVPQDSTGVAHILEHTSLCGSQRYPVRDPFFLMSRRSLNTFMNAFTASDWTAYPFASQNVKDFHNLLQVYLDAVFFPKLEAVDFAQEGYRVEFVTPDDPQSPLIYKGIVFNEMKGAMSAPINMLWHHLHHHLFPTTTYHHNSGGNPLEIPKLTHAQLKAFHATHYHPSNAIFMTYGNRPAESHQEWMCEGALNHFSKLDLKLTIPDEQRYTQPQRVVTHYAMTTPDDSLSNKTHIVLAWLLGHSTDVYEMMSTHLMTGVLLDNSACPLRQALETSGLGTAPSPLCGLDDSAREVSFICGLEGSNLAQAEAVEKLILQVLTQVAEQGVPQAQVDAVLHQIELSQREITGDHFPYGLHLLVNALSPMIHGGDPVAFLEIDPVLTRLRQDSQQRDFIPNLVRRWLLNNPHCVRLVMAPDAQLASSLVAAEMAQLEATKASLTEAEKVQIIAQTKALQLRHQTKDDADMLPKVDLTDIAADLTIPEGIERPRLKFPTTWFARGTNGIVYQKIIVELPPLAEELLDLLPLFCECLTEVGCGDKSYLETVAWQAAVTGGISTRLSVRGNISDVQTVRGVFSLSGKSLVRNQQALTELLRETLERARFDEWQRLRELIAQSRADSDNSITSRGHQLVMTASSSGISPTGALFHQWHGLVGMQKLKIIDDGLDDPDALAKLASQFTQIRDQLLTTPRQFLVVSEGPQHEEIANALQQCWQTSEGGAGVTLNQAAFGKSLPQQLPLKSLVKQAWSTSTQVNFCAKAYPTVASGHPDGPVLTVLGDFLRNGFLHTAIREQGGAYGGGASYDSDTGAFRFYSYRDPRLLETLNDFDRALDWLQTTPHEPRALEEAILGIISRIDRPGSPAGDAIKSFFSSLHGRTPAQRREFRQKILQVTIADLQRVANTYLQPLQANIAILSDVNTLAQLPAELGLEQIVL